MAMTMDKIRQQLSVIEPDESVYAGIGADEVPSLVALLDDEEPWLAARAVHVLSRVGTPEALEALARAGRSHRDEVRVAVAAGAAVLPPDAADPMLDHLLTDPDAGVRKFAIRSVSSANSEAIRARLSGIAADDDNSALRTLAHDRLGNLGG